MLNSARIAVFVSGGGTNLQALIDAEARGDLKSGVITLVISSRPDAYAIERANAAGIKTEVLKRGDERALLYVLEENKIDVIVLAGFMLILSKNFVDKYQNRIINVHPSLIPAYCGKGFYGIAVHEAVIAAGERVTGATVHIVNEIPDGGRILMQKEVPVLPGDTPLTLQRRVMEEAEWQLLPAATETLCESILNGGLR